MARYAEGTSVPVERSRGEIEQTLARYGADQFVYGWDAERALVAFRADGRQVRFTLPMPDRADRAITHRKVNASNYTRRTEVQQQEAYDQAQRQAWRALALVIKAKLEAVESGIVTFEQEFLAHMVLPDGRTFGDWASPQLEHAYAVGAMPELMPAVTAG